MKKFTITIIACLSLFSAIWSQNPVVENGVATYVRDTTIGQKFQAPDSWDKIVIEENVTIKGSFYFPTRTKPIEIMGKSRETSVITGITSMHHLQNTEGRRYSGIRCDKSPDVYIHHLRSYNPDKFHISAGFGNVKVESCDLIDDRGQHTTDGVHGGMNSTQVIDCYINTHDDALYISECFLVKNCTIVNNHNGSPFQIGWGKNIGTNSCKIENCVVIDNHTGSNRYFMGVVAWAGVNGDGPHNMNIEFINFKRELAPGAKESAMYQFGKGGQGIDNCTINVTGYCDPTDEIAYYVSTNCKLNSECDDCIALINLKTEVSNATCGEMDGSITFNIEDDPDHTEIKMSIDGGNTYTTVSDTSKNYTFANLAVGDYECLVEYGNGDCPSNLGIISIGCIGVGAKRYVEHNASGNYLGAAPGSVNTQNSTSTDESVQWDFVDTDDDFFFLVNVATGEKLNAPTNKTIAMDNTGTTAYSAQWKWIDKGAHYLLKNREYNKFFHIGNNGSSDISLKWNENSAGVKWNYGYFSTASEEISDNTVLNVFPNPASKVLNISLQTGFDMPYTIYSISGSVIQYGIVTKGDNTIHVSNLSNGLYILKLKTDTNILSTKINVRN